MNIAHILRTIQTPGVCRTDLALILAEIEIVTRGGVPGDIIEMGCCSGETSVAMGMALAQLGTDKRLHVCDSFAGLPKPGPRDGGYPKSGLHAATPMTVLARFKEHILTLPIIHKGWFNEIDDYPPQVAFAFCDGDLYQSILDSLAVVYPRLSPGGSVFVHDYGGPNYPGVQVACEVFFTGKQVAKARSSGPAACLGIFRKEAANDPIR